MKDLLRKPPFELRREIDKSLSGQLVDGFRQAIVSGYYRPGDLLPSIRDLSKMFEVSLIVPRDALDRLRREGFIVSRPGIGSVVVPRNVKVWHGHAQLVIPDVSGSYYANVFGDQLKTVLTEAGYSFTRVTVVPEGGAYDFSGLDLELNRQVDITVLLGNNAPIERHMSKTGVPFVVVGQEPCTLKGCIGTILRKRDSAVPDFVRHCRHRSVRSVWQIGRTRGYVDAVTPLREVGIAASEVVVGTDPSCPRPAGTVLGSIAHFERLLARGAKLPDVIFFTDDYVASGAVLALLRHGVKIPGDVSIVTWAHYGSGPCAPFSFTRMEMNAYSHGHAVADAIVSFLQTGCLDERHVLVPRYVVGDSFR